MKILLTAKQRGSTNVLAPVARELQARGHELTVYATGNENEAAGFDKLTYERIAPADDQYPQLVCGYDTVIVGMSGSQTSDGYFLRAANASGIPTVAVQDQNSLYQERLGINPADLPTILAVMDNDCVEKVRTELSGEMGTEAAKRCRIVGWAAFDHYAALRENFSEQQREDLLHRLGLNSAQPLCFYPTQNIHPESAYMQRSSMSAEDKKNFFKYESTVTQAVFETASALGVKLVIKPHPGEEYTTNFTKELADRYDFVYLPAKACSTQELMLASRSVTAGRSTCLTEATLLDKNVGAILPDAMGREWSSASPAVTLNAIPVTYDWDSTQDVLEQVTSVDETVARKLAENRKRFSVDGKASKRLADLIEGLGGQ
ncbi:MAG TPA: hypothetical protein VJA18_00135 [Candidatus Nanoarchaeia archaeon]|nr:hypothetical protein [Candidatus Nanoarchaeia archaeon]